jgi:threonine synthase
LPAGNLGNTSAFGKALHELCQLGLIHRIPRLAAVQAEGANPFYRSFTGGFRQRERVHAETIATAIKIGDPVSYRRAKRAIQWTDGVVTQVSDTEIMDAKAQVDAAGIGCEPASASSVAGIRRLVREGVVKPNESAVAVLTGHLLKDPGATVDYHLNQLEGITPAYANAPVVIEPTVEAVQKALSQ